MEQIYSSRIREAIQQIVTSHEPDV